jgi:hypothetical protein
MRKISLFVLFGIFMFLFAGCGANGNPLDVVGSWKCDTSSTASNTYEFKSDGTYIYTTTVGSISTSSNGTYIGDYQSGQKMITLYNSSSNAQDSYFYSIVSAGTKTYLNLSQSTTTTPTKYTKQ